MRNHAKTMQPRLEFAIDPESDELHDNFDLGGPTYRSPLDNPQRRGDLPRHLSMVEDRLAKCRLDLVEYSSPVRALLVGECPGPNTGWATPLFPSPPRSSAGRLMGMSDLTPGQYLGHLYRKNLVDDREWDRSLARERARRIVTSLFEMPKSFRVVMCGKRVAKSFNVKNPEFWIAFKVPSGQTAVVIPHPSGANLVYNESSARQQTREWLRWAALDEEMP